MLFRSVGVEAAGQRPACRSPSSPRARKPTWSSPERPAAAAKEAAALPRLLLLLLLLAESAALFERARGQRLCGCKCPQVDRSLTKVVLEAPNMARGWGR